MKGLKDRLLVILTSGFGLGLLPVAPGTFGAAVGLVWHLAAWAAGFGPTAIRVWCLAGVILFLVMHYALTPWAQRYWGESDPGHYIIDEIPGYLMVPVLSLPAVRIEFILLGFVIERVCDIIKLPVARYFDRKVHNATGVVMDDIIAGIYAAVLLSLAIRFIPLP